MSSPPTPKSGDGRKTWPTNVFTAPREASRPIFQEEQRHLQALPSPWRGDIVAARPVVASLPVDAQQARTVAVSAQIAAPTPKQHPLAVYEQLLVQLRGAPEMNA